MKETFCLTIVIYIDVINTHETTNRVYILHIHSIRFEFIQNTLYLYV